MSRMTCRRRVAAGDLGRRHRGRVNDLAPSPSTRHRPAVRPAPTLVGDGGPLTALGRRQRSQAIGVTADGRSSRAASTSGIDKVYVWSPGPGGR